ncbi:class II aldolase/adducin family protein [Lachnospiraceae bacterium 62-35]
MAIFSNMISFNPNPQTAQEAVEQCVIVNRLLSNEGILDAYGHVSVRNPENPETFFQSRRMVPEMVTRKDIMEFDMDGNVISNQQFQHYREILMHAEIYKARPDVNAICHNHARELIPFSSTGIPLRPLSQPAGMFYKGVPTFNHPEITSGLVTDKKETCAGLAQVLGEHRAAFIGVHGVVVVGENAINLITCSIALRDNAIAQLQAMQLGSPRYLTEAEGKAATQTMLSTEDAERMWNYWLRRAKNILTDLYW